MGKRGPGAKPTRQAAVPVGRCAEKPWTKPGLSRPDRVIAFVESLDITQGKGAGGPFIVREWQRDLIGKLYGREIREALVTMGRKNGKTELAAALALCHLVGPEAEVRGEVYSAAADQYQAARIFRSMEAFIIRDAWLSARINLKRHEKMAEVSSDDEEGSGSTYRALSSDATKAHSLNPSFVVADELAQWKNRELYDNIRTGFGARESQLLLVISTKSSDPHSIMTEVTNYGRDVLAGTVDDPSFAAIIYEVPLVDDEDELRAQMSDEELWKLANPALGDFLRLEDMRKEAAIARRLPSREAAFRNLKLNQEVDADERFIPAPEWQACRAEVDVAALRGRPCWGGLDLSSTTDLTSLVLFFPLDGGVLLPWFWVPGDRLNEREERDRVPYRTWRDRGLIEAPHGRAIDRFAIARRMAELASLYDLRGLAYDRYRMEDLLKILDDEGIDLPLVPWGQGFGDMSPAVDAFETLVLDREVRHDGNPVLAWCVSNAVVQADAAGNRKLNKEKSREKIDGLVAAVMAVGLHAKAPPEVDTKAFRPDDIAGLVSGQVAAWT